MRRPSKSKPSRIDQTRAARTTTLGFLLLGCLFAGAACRLSNPPRPNRAQGQTPSASSPSASAINVDNYGWTLNNNQRAKLADYKGKVVVLDFYATWCEPCRQETPRLVQLQNQYGAQGLQVIGLNVGGEDDLEEVPAYAKEFAIPYPLAVPDDELADGYLREDQNIPQAFVFDRNGNLIRRFVGFTEEGGQELERLVRESLAAK